MRYPQLAVVDPDWLHRLLGRPFRAAQSSLNGIVRLGRRLAEGHLPVLLVEGGDATQLWLQRGARLFPSEQMRPHLRTPAHPGPQGILQQQSSLLSYVHGFRFCVLVCLVCAALAFLFKKVGKPTGPIAAH